MKQISKLGLELIELEGDLLLVDDKKLIINGYIQRGTEKPVINKPDFWFDFGVPYKNVIASTKPLKGLPLLMIEDEVEDIVGENLKRICSWETYQYHPIGRYAKQALEEHEKAKETFKFTEDDLRKAIKMSKVTKKYKYGEGRVFVNSDESIIQSLAKKELWIEVEEKEYPVSSVSFDSVKFSKFDQPKITKNQIKAVWK